MDWDLTLEKLRAEAFRPTVPPPVRMPRWAVAALVGAGLTLSGASCTRDVAQKPDTTADMGRGNSMESVLGEKEGPEVMPAEMLPEEAPTKAQPEDPPPAEPSPPMQVAMTSDMKDPAANLPLMIMLPPADPNAIFDMPSDPGAMYAGPRMEERISAERNTLPKIVVTGLFLPGVPMDVKKVLQGIPYTIGSCFKNAADQGLVGKSGNLSVTVSIAGGKMRILNLGGTLSSNKTFAQCIQSRLNGKSMGSSEEAKNYTHKWTFSVQLEVAGSGSPESTP